MMQQRMTHTFKLLSKKKKNKTEHKTLPYNFHDGKLENKEK